MIVAERGDGFGYDSLTALKEGVMGEKPTAGEDLTARQEVGPATAVPPARPSPEQATPSGLAASGSDAFGEQSRLA